MSTQAKNYHSVTFIDPKTNNTYNTWDTWHLIPSSRPVIAQPTPVYKNIEIPGKNGTLDLSEYLTGQITYSDRKGSIEFYVTNTPYYDDWKITREALATVLNGKKMKVYLDDESEYYYLGRVVFKEWRSEPQYSKAVIEYQLNPFKYNAQTNKEAGL